MKLGHLPNMLSSSRRSSTFVIPAAAPAGLQAKTFGWMLELIGGGKIEVMNEEEKSKLKAQILWKTDQMVFAPYDRLGNPEDKLADESLGTGTVMIADLPRANRIPKERLEFFNQQELLRGMLCFQKTRVDLIIASRGLFPRVERDTDAFWLSTHTKEKAGWHLGVAIRCAKALLSEGAKLLPAYLEPRIVISCGQLQVKRTERGVRLEGAPVDEARDLLKSDIRWTKQILMPTDLVTNQDRRSMRFAGEINLSNGKKVSVSEFKPAIL